MLSKYFKYLLAVFIFMGAYSDSFGQPKKRDRKVSLDCVVCHVSWHDDINLEKSLLPDIDAPIRIEGLPARVPTTEMCFTCHDGTVKDSRQIFSSRNHQSGMDVSKVTINDLPLDKNNQIYCGTCHTPHSLKPEQVGGLAPFLRVEVTNSDLCLACHEKESKSHINHPIHVQVNPDHTMPERTFFGANNSIECMTCHPIHGENATHGVTGDDRTELCSSCHEPYFNIVQTDHDLITTFENRAGDIGPSLGEQDACSACHVSHNGKGNNMWAMDLDMQDGKNAYCLGCHSEEGLGREKIYSHSGHAVSGVKLKKAIPELGLNARDELLCTSCHSPHQWEFSQKHAVTEANEEGTEYTSFLKLPDDAQGQLCIACHENQASILASDHSVTREGFQQHFRSSGSFRGQCSSCHESHGKSGYRTESSDLKVDESRLLCESCHSASHYPTTVGGLDHPMDAKLDPSVNLPGYEGSLTCITCHDPHLWGKSVETSPVVDLQGDDRNSFLRKSNWPEPTLCITCHEEQKHVLKTDHDLGDKSHSACSFCHASHNSQAQHGILRFWEESEGTSYNEKFCFACHQSGGSAEKKIPEAWTHPHEYGTVTHNARGTGEWIDFPLFGESKPQENFGFIDCFTCHDPHKWSFDANLLQTGSENAEGDYMTSFLRNPSSETLCADCHGIGTLWKFNYYHDPVKRKRY
jgi:predicted CXXCH cytochrome family protein